MPGQVGACNDIFGMLTDSDLRNWKY